MPKCRKIMLLLEIAFYLLTTFLILDFLILSVDSLKDDSASTSNRELIIDGKTRAIEKTKRNQQEIWIV